MGAWAMPTLGSIPLERTSTLAATTLIFRMYRLLGVSLYDDLAVHTLVIVSGNEAGELECAALGEPPDELTVPLRHQTSRVRVVMLHLGMLFHDFRVLAIFGDCRQDKFMILLTLVVQNEADVLASAHFDLRGLEAHFPAALEHLDLDNARRLRGIAGFACRKASVILVRGYRDRHR